MSDETSTAGSLNSLRETYSRYINYFVWANVLLVIGTAWWVGTISVMVVSGAALLLGAAATGTWLKYGTGTETRIATAVSLAALVALFVASLATDDPATSYQLDGHMYFFAVLAILAGWVDWRSLVAYAGVVAVHHIVFNFALPWAVFPGGSDFLRVVFHAVIVVVEVVALWWTVERLQRAFDFADKAKNDAEASHVHAGSGKRAHYGRAQQTGACCRTHQYLPSGNRRQAGKRYAAGTCDAIRFPRPWLSRRRHVRPCRDGCSGSHS